MASAAVSVLLTRDFAHVHPDHPLEVVLERLGKSPGHLPVVSRNDVNRVQGIITPQTIMQFLQKTWDEQRTSSANNGELT